MKNKLYSLFKVVLNPKLTLRDSLKILFFWATGCPVRIRSKTIRYPFQIREKLDLSTFFSVILGDQYLTKADFPVRTIIDAGANIGTSTVYFASLYPEAEICAIEPSQTNFERLKANTEEYPNVKCLCGALAGREGHVKIKDTSCQHDSFRVGQCDEESAGSVPAWDLPACLELMGWSHVDLLKVDVEGAEVEIFSEAPERWMNLVNHFFIETHDSSSHQASKVVFKVLSAIDAPIYCRPVGENISVRRLADRKGTV